MHGLFFLLGNCYGYTAPYTEPDQGAAVNTAGRSSMEVQATKPWLPILGRK